MNIGDRSGIILWHDSWIPSVVSFRVVHPPYCPIHVLDDKFDRST